MSLFSSMGDWFSTHKKMGAVVIILILAGIGAAGFFGFQEYNRRQTGVFALESLQKALTPPHPHDLARLIDFNGVSRDLATAGREVFPFLHDGADPERSISHTIQKTLLKKFMEKQQSKPQFPEDESEMAQLSKPLQLLPDDFIDQLLTNATVRDNGPNSAIITVKVNHKQLNRDFDIQLGLQHTADGWMVRRVLNAKELASQLREAALGRFAGLRNAYLAKNADTTKKMDQAIPVEGCAANAGVLSDGKTFLMIVRARAKNNSDVQINNFNLDTSVYGKDGQVVWRRFLNVAKPVPPGAVFDHSWSFDLDSKSPEAQAILRQIPLACRTKWQTLSLGNGQVWHIAEVPNPDRACSTAGHNHPEGFCMLPIFQR